MRKIILASTSLRRQELLRMVGLQFEVEPSNYQEDIYSGKEPHELARSISRGKALAVAGKHRNALIIAADTLGVFNGKVIGKPDTEKEAKEILSVLSGNSHFAITGFTIIDIDNNKILSESVETRVYMRKLTKREIEKYVNSKEPMGKAGAYAIQGLGSLLVERIEGDFFNVMGLPLFALAQSLKKFGIKIL
jgi:septum formation protein